MERAEHLRTNRPLAWDYRLGLRGCGLIAYGALPASLGALGAFKPPDQTGIRFGIYSLPFIIIIALAPVALVFLLTRQRLASWYPLWDYLPCRAAVVTAAIILTSALVSLGTRIVAKPDIAAAFDQWLALPIGLKSNALWHALLLSFAYLVGSSTLFLAVIKEDSGLPLLPDKELLTEETNLRKSLAETVMTARDLTRAEVAIRVEEVRVAISSAKAAIVNLRKFPLGLGRRQFYDELDEELDALRAAIDDAAASETGWAKYWTANQPEQLNYREIQRRQRLRRHSRLKVRRG